MLRKMFLVSFFFMAPAAALAGTSAFDKSMAPVLANYLKIHDSLARDTTDGVKDAALAIAKEAAKLDAKSVSGEHAAHYKGLSEKIIKAAKEVAAAGDLKSARDAFKALSRPMAMWGTMSKPAGIDVVFCSMAKGSWLQKAGDVRNPYHGASMLACGEVVGGAGHKAHDGGHGHH